MSTNHWYEYINTFLNTTNYSQRKLAYTLGVAPSTVGTWKKGMFAPCPSKQKEYTEKLKEIITRIETRKKLMNT